MLIKQFFDGLEDEDMRFQVLYLQHPHSLDNALDMCEEYRAFKCQRKDFRRFQSVRAIEEGPPEVRINAVSMRSTTEYSHLKTNHIDKLRK